MQAEYISQHLYTAAGKHYYYVISSFVVSSCFVLSTRVCAYNIIKNDVIFRWCSFLLHLVARLHIEGIWLPRHSQCGCKRNSSVYRDLLNLPCMNLKSCSIHTYVYAIIFLSWFTRYIVISLSHTHRRACTHIHTQICRCTHTPICP